MGLGDLKSQLLKKGHVSQKQARRAAHQERLESKKVGHDEREAEEEAKRQARAVEADKKREADRERERERREAQARREEALRVVQIAETGRLVPEGRPNRRWYFISRDGRVPYLMVDDALGRRLENGSAALVESPHGQFWAVSRETAGKLSDAEPDWIRCWHSAGERARPA